MNTKNSKWNESYSTGIKEIDIQHQTLLNFIDRLGKYIQDGKSKLALESAMVFLEDYARIHFQYEEGCMTKYRCPVALENKTAHEEFLKNFESYKERFEKDKMNTALAEEILQMCAGWLTSHIGSIDTHLRSCAKDEDKLTRVQ